MIKQLQMVSGPVKGEIKFLSGDAFLIGRSTEADWIVDDSDII